MQTSVKCGDLNIIKHVNSMLFIVYFASKRRKRAALPSIRT